ncbi:hypothetical protein Blue_171 [Bacillus phage Deep Blue]|uniref:Uncharacterized protein n=1 Tax=Bacillus phage Deep Blue TaxID=1792245 RepID=A0A140HLY2_9CAUD|nr:hypothetical protein Blue_171 [Bacillus phage Deep Blue]AMO25994.1 hypothetical protein Blue_171 [Bacillus phage Deep Blue]
MEKERKRVQKGPQYKKRQRDKLAYQLGLVIEETMDEFDIEDLQEDKPRSEWTSLDYFIEEYIEKKRHHEMCKVMGEVRG